MLKKESSVPQPPKTTILSVDVGPKAKVTRDLHSGARVMTIPFDFPSEEPACVIVCRLKDEDWVPSEDIKRIIIEFNE